MTSYTRLAAIALAVSFAVPAGAVFAQYGPAPVRAAYGQEGGWDAPPAEFRDAQRQGFHDGIEGARKDFDNHRQPNVNNRDEFRHPNVAHDLRRDYRDGFRRGYQVAVDHLYHGRP